MADFDPCECIWNHENAMQRLINMVSITLHVYTAIEN